MTLPLCQPADASRDGLHYIVHVSSITGEPSEAPRIAKWAKDWGWDETWTGKQPQHVYAAGYRYLCPVPTPAEIAALVAAATDALGQLYLLGVEHSGLTAVLAPFQPKGDADG